MRRILLVEDEEILRESYEMILNTEPYIIDTAANGQEALVKFKENAYDLILLDIMMPVMDGISFLEKANQLEGEMPKVVVMSNLAAGSKEIDQAMKLGADKSILKASMSPRQFLTTVRSEISASI
jgi:CheY-like chemotaxis protein